MNKIGKQKFLIFIGLTGVLLLIGGIIFSPSLLSKLTSLGRFRSYWTVAQIHLIQYFLLSIGFALIVCYTILKRFSVNNLGKQFTISIMAIGITVTILGIVFSPAFVEKNFTSIKFIEDHNMDTLLSFQLLSISVGMILFLVSYLIIIKKYLKRGFKTITFAAAVIIIVYLIIINSTYLNEKYPRNIIFKPAEYGRVWDLLIGREILLSEYEPKSTLVVKNKEIQKAKFPVIDFNFHMSSQFKTDYDKEVLSPKNFLKSIDSVGVKLVVNLDGPGDDDFFIKQYQKIYPDKFLNYCPVWFPERIIDQEYLNDIITRFERHLKNGESQGIKIWKYLGLRTRDTLGNVIPIDDPWLAPVWEKAAEYNIPIVWHMGDPAAFFTPVDRFSERFIELGRYPQWSFYGPRFPSRETILKGRENVLKRYPNITFIGAHMGMNPEDLSYISYLLDTYPNYYVEISTVLSDLGRQPYTAREFFIKYQDRILFGTDGGSLFGIHGWSVAKFYRSYFEFLETSNEYIDYPMQGAINQGSWKIYGINLPDDVLQKIYYKNAEKILKVKIE